MGDFKGSVTAAAINLADDAPWKKIQKNTFTRWCNEHLKSVNLQIQDLKLDLSDGLVLISLLEVLSHKRMFRKYHARPTFRQLKLDNVSVALEFLDLEKVKLVSIDSKAIVDGNLKLILGLVWTLIQHYSISTPVWEDEVNDSVSKLTPEMRLLGWIQNKVPELPITNFSQDWQDGKALGALVDGLAPGLCPDWESWDSVHRVSNTKEAMQQADDWLGVPQVRESYILIPKPKACRATGRGLQSKGIRVGELADFKVDTQRAGPGNLEVHIRDCRGKKLHVKEKSHHEGVHSFEYSPTTEGDHTVDITWADQPTAKSPFKVHVSPEAGPQKIRAWGPGLEGGTVGSPAQFMVEAIGADPGMLSFAIEGPSQAKIECEDYDDGSCLVRFWPTEAGEFAVHVMCNDEEIKGSPFMASIRPRSKGFHPDKREDGECIDVLVSSEQPSVFVCTYTPLSLSKHTIAVSWGGVMVPGSPFVVTPRRITITPCSPVWFKPDGSVTYYSEMNPDEEISENLLPGGRGDLEINVISPSNAPADATKVRAHGRGLREGILGQKAEFIIDTSRAGSGRLAVKVDGPIDVTLQVLDNQDGTCTVFYLPTELGIYKINIHFDNAHIPGSPFEARVHLPYADLMPVDPSEVLVTGPGLLEGKVGEPCVVNIDCPKAAGLRDLSVQAVSDSGVVVQTEVTENEDGTLTVVYVPRTAGVYTLLLKYGGKVMPVHQVKVDPKVYKSRVKVRRKGTLADGESDASQVVAKGLGLQKGLTGCPNSFCVNTSNCSSGDLDITVEGPSECHVTCKDNSEGVYNMEYTPSEPGEYKISISCGDNCIPGSPFVVSVEDISNTASSRRGLQSGKSISTKAEDSKVTAVTSDQDWVNRGSTSPLKKGRESFFDLHSPCGSSSPILFSGGLNCDHDRELSSAHGAQIFAPGIKGGLCGKTPQMFIIDPNRSGEMPETMAVVRPDGSMEVLEMVNDGDGSFRAVYLPSMDGCHFLKVKFADEKSFSRQLPFEVLPADEAADIKISAPGLTSGMCPPLPQTFILDCSATGKVPQFVSMTTPNGLSEIIEVRHDGDGTYSINYTPSEEGPYSFMVKYTDDDSFCSPFKFQVLQSSDYKVPESPDSRNGVHASGSVLEEVCVNTPQSFTIEGNSSGEVPETVAVVTPDGKIKLLGLEDNGDGSYRVAYSPNVEGPHALMVKYSNEDSFRSPLRFHARTPSTEDFQNKEESSPCAGNDLAKSQRPFAKRRNVPPNIAAMAKTKGLTKLADAKDNRDGTMEKVYASNRKRSSSTMDNDSQQEPFGRLSGLQAEVRPNSEPTVCSQSPQSFTISCNESGKPPECVLMITPAGETELAEVTENADGTYSVKYSPTNQGLHSLMVKYADDESFYNPVRFHVLPQSSGDDEEAKTTNMFCRKQEGEVYSLGAPQTRTTSSKFNESSEIDRCSPEDFKVLKKKNLEARCSAVRSPLLEDLQSHQPSSLHASNGHKAFPNKVEGRNAIPLDAINQAGFLPCDIVLPADLNQGQITGEVVMPSGKTATPNVIDNKDGTMSMQFDPSEEGLHQILVKSSENDLPDLPLQYYANCHANRSTIAYGHGLVYGIANEKAMFTVCQEDSASSELDITIEGPSEADVHCLDNEDGTCTVSYLPTKPGDYQIQVQCNDMPIPGSPFKAKITDGNMSSQVKLGSSVDFSLDITEKDIKQLTARIMSPSGNDVPCSLKTQPDSHIGISFIPKEAGDHLVSIMKDGEHVTNSPISLSISQAEMGDASQVKAFGPGLHTGQTFCRAQFVVDTWDAGYGGLTVAIEGPSKVDVHSEELQDGTCNISYCPIKAGTYQISIKFSDEHIPGSPFTAVVTDRGLMRENITYEQKTAPIASTGSECSLAFKLPGADLETLSAYVLDPSGSLGEAVISPKGTNTYTVSFLAKEVGVYDVIIQNQGQMVPGGPLQYTVGPLGQGGWEKVQVWGRGFQNALATVPADFNIWSREAGAGTLSVSVEGPGKIQLHFDDLLDGSCIVSYMAQEPGDYEVSVMFNEDHVSESPFRVTVSAAAEDALTQGQCGKFDDTQMSNGYEDASSNNTTDSNAEQVFLSDASKVICHGPGLSKGFLGCKNTFYVDFSKAGRNLLFVGMHGPTVPCERVSIVHMGECQYRITYTVKERGKYILAIKWGDEHIPGSPFHITVL
ncbi:hypothetical protein DNTS_018426 [Danionella cerebrum]|uniref:Calponin-homology (CH) domain-containing protein n=1 Tax=Danionella cerebrum TaxID=2873325 RepID=A0A553RGW0_9TELE|nr:hypothetical protein DNTS_018426 [Danionella translucida]